MFFFFCQYIKRAAVQYGHSPDGFPNLLLLSLRTSSFIDAIFEFLSHSAESKKQAKWTKLRQWLLNTNNSYSYNSTNSNSNSSNKRSSTSNFFFFNNCKNNSKLSIRLLLSLAFLPISMPICAHRVFISALDPLTFTKTLTLIQPLLFLICSLTLVPVNHRLNNCSNSNSNNTSCSCSRGQCDLGTRPNSRWLIRTLGAFAILTLSAPLDPLKMLVKGLSLSNAFFFFV